MGVKPISDWGTKVMTSTRRKFLRLPTSRTSSAANVGADNDSDRRQREAIAAFAGRAGYELVGEFYDAAVSGADPIDTRPGFAAMLEQIEGNELPSGASTGRGNARAPAPREVVARRD
jgi:hypothetical protein